jgi:hypothetical protein
MPRRNLSLNLSLDAQVPKALEVLGQWCLSMAGALKNKGVSHGGPAPHKVHSSNSGQCTELVCFRLQEGLALSCIRDLGGDAAAVHDLPLGSFIAWNRLSGERLDGRVF